MPMQPIPLLDVPADDPGMGYDKYAESLAHMIANAKPARFTIGVFGGYGSGKTTLMLAIKNKLPQNESIIPVQFNAWRYDHEEHLFLPFLSALYREASVHTDPSFGKQLFAAGKAFLRGLSFTVPTPVAEVGMDVDKMLAAEQEYLMSATELIIKDYSDVYAELSKIPLDNGGKTARRIVVFIDDLDRCVPKKAFALLEALKSFMDIDGFMFVLGLDPRAIEKYLTDKYGPHFVRTEEYLQKMIQVPFYLPSPAAESIKEEITKAIERIRNDPPEDVSPTFAHCERGRFFWCARERYRA